MQKTFLVFASFSAAITVALGALGAHYLKSQIATGLMTVEQIQSFDTGVKYQMYHSLALILLGIIFEKNPSRILKISGYLFMIGILFFSGSIYLLSTQHLSEINFKWMGPVTPLGGICFIAGWILFAVSFLKSKS